jgi:hypothetical protein
MMRRNASSSDRLIASVTIDPTETTCSPYGGAPFACLVWSHARDVPPEERARVASVLLEAGCRYVVCGGYDCEAWHDAFDEEIAVRSLDDPTAPLVMTTWHEGESAEEVAEFFVNCTTIDGAPAAPLLVVNVGRGDSNAVIDGAVERALRR